MVDMDYWLGRKYDILAQQAGGEYQKNTAEAYQRRELGAQVAPDAASQRQLQGAQGGYYRGMGQEATERAATEATDRNLDPSGARAAARQLLQGGYVPQAQGGQGAPPAQAPAPAPAPGGAQAPQGPAPAPQWAQLPPRQDQQQQAPAPTEGYAPAPVNAPPPVVPTQLQSGEVTQGQRAQRPNPLFQLPLTSLLKPLTPNATPRPLYSPQDSSSDSTDIPLRKGTANVKSPPSKAGKSGGPSKAGGPPKGLEAILPALMAAMQGGGAGGPPGGPPGAPPGGPPPAPGRAGLRKGSANVKSKGGKTGSSGASSGLEQILPTLMAASQAGQMGGGAVGPQAPPSAAPPTAPGAAAQPGFARGATMVRRYADGTSDIDAPLPPIDTLNRLPIGGGPAAPRATGVPSAPAPTGAPSSAPIGGPAVPSPIGLPAAPAAPPPMGTPAAPMGTPAAPTGMRSPSSTNVGTPAGLPSPSYPGLPSSLPGSFGDRLAAVARPSLNVEDRRGVGPSSSPSTLSSALSTAGNFLGGVPEGAAIVGRAIGTAIFGQPVAAPGSLEAQIGFNDIPGGRFTPLQSIGGSFSPPQAAPLSSSSAAPLSSSSPAPSPDSSQAPSGLARGAASIRTAHQNPGYPFGAGYLFGATAVPGQGSGTVDKVPAMLAPHEAVLNRAAADKLGRGKIAALNAQGVKKMGLRRGTARVA